ncbi:MAG TPA: NHL repeat-containing protein [Geobacteraceae bacterium]
MRSIIKYTLLALLLLLPLTALGAEALKLKYATGIYQDDKEGQLKQPEGVACNDKGVLIVADTGNGRLLRYTYQDKAAKGGTEIKVAQLAYPVRVQLNSKGDIFVLDGKSHTVVRLNPDGGFVGTVDPKGITDPAKVVVKSFKIDASDNVYLLDIYGERVLQVDPSGKLLGKIPFPKGYGFISDLAVTAGGDVLLIDSVNSVIYSAKKEKPEFTPLTKSMRDYMNFAGYIVTGPSGGEIYLLDQDGGAIVAVGPDGSFQGRQLSLGWKPGFLYYPSQLCIAKNDFFIADRNNSRVQVFENVK